MHAQLLHPFQVPSLRSPCFRLPTRHSSLSSLGHYPSSSLAPRRIPPLNFAPALAQILPHLPLLSKNSLTTSAHPLGLINKWYSPLDDVTATSASTSSAPTSCLDSFSSLTSNPPNPMERRRDVNFSEKSASFDCSSFGGSASRRCCCCTWCWRRTSSSRRGEAEVSDPVSYVMEIGWRRT